MKKNFLIRLVTLIWLYKVGEPFAEQPYAVAVQQGSHLQEEISKVILELQKDRYFETLYGKYVLIFIMKSMLSKFFKILELLFTV